MIGIVITTHCNLGDALIDAAEFILGKRPEAMVSVSIDLNENAEILRKKLPKE
jgi:mannose PTS system EIIA component